jgi:serine/threonine protein kinase
MNASEYHLLRQLGGGQEGSIFLATKDGLYFAIKELVGTPSEGEAQMLASINHPGVIGFYEALEGEPTALVLEYASEGNNWII